jgi:hypothetical protein
MLGAVAGGGDLSAERQVEGRGNHDAASRGRGLFFPCLVNEIRRSDIVRLLDDVEQENGPRLAQAVFAFLLRGFKLVREQK